MALPVLWTSGFLFQISMALDILQLALWQLLMDIMVQKLVRWTQSYYWSTSYCIVIFFLIMHFLFFFVLRHQRECYPIRKSMTVLLKCLVGMRNWGNMCCIFILEVYIVNHGAFHLEILKESLLKAIDAAFCKVFLKRWAHRMSVICFGNYRNGPYVRDHYKVP